MNKEKVPNRILKETAKAAVEGIAGEPIVAATGELLKGRKLNRREFIKNAVVAAAVSAGLEHLKNVTKNAAASAVSGIEVGKLLSVEKFNSSVYEAGLKSSLEKFKTEKDKVGLLTELIKGESLYIELITDIFAGRGDEIQKLKKQFTQSRNQIISTLDNLSAKLITLENERFNEYFKKECKPFFAAYDHYLSFTSIADKSRMHPVNPIHQLAAGVIIAALDRLPKK